MQAGGVEFDKILTIYDTRKKLGYKCPLLGQICTIYKQATISRPPPIIDVSEINVIS